MSVNDPIADFLTRILKEEGYINDFSEKGAGAEKVLVVGLKYGSDGQRAIAGLRRMSRPGRRVYRKQKNIPRVLDGLGVAILSTSQGILTDHQARRQGIGGEVLCFVY